MQKRPLKDQLLFVEAWALLACARLILVFLPFKRIVPLLGKARPGAAGLDVKNNPAILSSVKIAIARACRYSPWRAKCFEQALAAKMMLKRRHLVSTIFFGVYKNEDTGKLNAHAWVKSGELIITGGVNLERYSIVSSFKN